MQNLFTNVYCGQLLCLTVLDYTHSRNLISKYGINDTVTNRAADIFPISVAKPNRLIIIFKNRTALFTNCLSFHMLCTSNSHFYAFLGELNNDISIAYKLGQFTRNYTQTVKRAADNKRRYAPGWVHSTCLLRGFPKGAAPHLAHDFAEQSVVCYTLCRRCPENTVAAGEGKGI